MNEDKGREYFLPEKLPHLWCSGCSHGTVVVALSRALARLQIAPSSTVVVTGIGCFGKADDYFATHALHGTHGRALAFATGIKAVKEDLTVLALMGDGDCCAIGGNHLIHAARRNMDITAIVSNNLNYGMTGGQYSSTTPLGSKTSTSVYGFPEHPFDLCRLVEAAGATFVARCTPYQGSFNGETGAFLPMLEHILTSALQHRGFSFVEVLSCCPTHYGRNNRQGEGDRMVRLLQETTLPIEDYKQLPPGEQEKYISTGILSVAKRPDFNTLYTRVREQAQGKVPALKKEDGEVKG